jgi:hypothetical protein
VFVAGLITGGVIFGYLGLRLGGMRAFMRLGRVEYNKRRRDAGV